MTENTLKKAMDIVDREIGHAANAAVANPVNNVRPGLGIVAGNALSPVPASEIEKRFEALIEIMRGIEDGLGQQVAALTGVDPVAIDRAKINGSSQSEAGRPGFIERLDRRIAEARVVTGRLDRQVKHLSGALS